MEPLAQLTLSDGATVALRRAVAGDVAAIVGLLADDPLGAMREGADDAHYESAFAAIDADERQLLVVAVDARDAALATLQLSFLPGLSRGGAWRAQIEAVRVAGAMRGRGLGEAMLRWAIAEGGRRGCALVQLTADMRRADAHRFYERLGFVATHEGFKRAP